MPNSELHATAILQVCKIKLIESKLQLTWRGLLSILLAPLTNKIRYWLFNLFLFFLGQHLKIERSALPDDFQDLWPKVIGETGAAPVSYIKVKDANVISMSLPSQIRQSSHILTTAEHKLKFNSNYVPDRASLHDSPVSGSHDVAVNTVPKRVSSGVTRISKCFDYQWWNQFLKVFF